MGKLTLGSLFDGSGGFPLGGILAGIEPKWNSEIEPFAIRVTTKRLPQVKHYGDITELDGGKIEPVDIITFGSPCFPKGTLVLTDEGYLEIENLRVGMRVLTHKGRWKKITAVGSKTANTVILLGNHYGLECTPNHPIYTAGDNWVRAEDMQGRLWAVPVSVEELPIRSPKAPKSNREKLMPAMDEDLFYFVGRWLGDGRVRDTQRPNRPKGQRYSTILLCDSCDKEHELCEIVEKISEHYCIDRTGSCVKVKFNGRQLCDWLTDNFGRYAYGKKIPSWVYGLSENYRSALLKGVFESDGYRVKGKSAWKVATVSKKLAEGLRLLGELEGYTTTVHYTAVSPKTEIEGRVVNQKPYYTVVFSKATSRRKRDGLHSWYKVKSVKETGEKKTVYNITVEDDNSYVADGIVVHNCQDMSIAGKRSGLDGSRSCLFYEAVRVIKEMRSATNGKYPRYIVWENVPGAFSSNNGEDFRTVLEEIIKIAEPQAPALPMPEKGWAYADAVMGDGWSIAYRVLDSQYWSVPQRRRRIYLVADFGSGSAADILFKSEGMSGYSAQGFGAWQRAANDSQSCSGTSGIAFDGYNGAVDDKAATLGVNCGMSSGRNGIVLNDQGGQRMDVTVDVTTTLRAEAHHPPCVMESAGFCTEHSAKSRSIGYEEEMSPTLRAGVIPAAVSVFENHSQDTRYTGPLEVAPSVSATYGTGGNNQPFVVNGETPKTLKIRCGCEGGGKGTLIQDNKSATLGCNNDQTLFEPKNWDGGQVSPTLTKQNAGGSQRMPDKDNFNCVLEPFGISAKDSNAMKSDNPHSGIYKAKTSRTLDGNGGSPACNQGGIAIVEGVKCYDLRQTSDGTKVVRNHVYETDTSRTLGTMQQDPAGNHGGVAVVEQKQAYALQGSMIGRKDENGPQGNGINEDVSFTLNATDRHAVYAMTTGSFQQVEEDKSPTLMARDYKDPNAVCYGIGRDAYNQGTNAKFKPSFEEEKEPPLMAQGPGAVIKAEPEYTVRRLTPTECARLQGFPDWWCKNLETEKPTDEEVYFWYKVFADYAKATGGKPKTDKQIRTWLKSPHSDSAEYKLWGNGVALPCVYFVLAGIVWANENDKEHIV